MASSGMFCIEYQPPMTAAAISRKTTIGFRAESSMMRLIMLGSRWSGPRCRVQLAFGIDEEIAGRYDAFAGFQAAQDLDTIVELPPRLHVARLQVSVLFVDENHLPQP